MGKKIHKIDGKGMTVDQIAEMLGVTESTLINKRFVHGQCSYQMVVDMYRANMLQSRDDHWERHLVNGEWITVRDAAARLGVREKSIRNWRATHKDRHGNMPTLAEAIEHFRKYKTGEVKRYKGSIGKEHYVKGRKMTVHKAAEKYGIKPNTLYNSMNHYGRTLDAAVKHIEALRMDRAQKEIMAILKEG